jgi:hypothetical protein
MNENNVILFPKYEELNGDVQKLRTELSMLVLERDELKYVICRNIETKYLVAFGGLEYRTFEAECNMRRLKRKTEIIRMKLNRQEKVIMEDIDDQLDAEFEDYKKQLDDRLHEINEAIDRSKETVLSKEDAAELKKSYRKIIKALHPDLNPEISEEQLAMFLRAVAAYEEGDLETIRIIASTLSDPAAENPETDKITELNKKKDKLEEMLKQVGEQISTIKAKYPYTMKELLEDEDKREKRKKELEATEKECMEQADYYQKQLDSMI